MGKLTIKDVEDEVCEFIVIEFERNELVNPRRPNSISSKTGNNLRDYIMSSCEWSGVQRDDNSKIKNMYLIYILLENL